VRKPSVPELKSWGAGVCGLVCFWGVRHCGDIGNALQITDVAAFMLAAANPAVKAIKTTTLLTMEDGIDAMRKAPGGYRAPTE